MADTFDLSQLQGLLGQFMPNEKDQAAAQKAALIQMGLGLLGARKGREWEQAGNAGQNAMATQQAYLQNAMTQRHQAMQAAGGAMDLLSKTQSFQDDQKSRALMQQLFGGGPAGGVGGGGVINVAGGPAPGGLPPGPGGPPAEPMPMPLAPGPKGPPPFSAPGSSKQSKFDQYSALADQFMRSGLPAQAQKFADIAEKFRPKLKDTKTMTQNGQRVQVQEYEDGTIKVLTDVSPDQEKAHFLDTGSKVGAVDPFTGQPIPGGGLYNKEMTPGEVASNALGQKNYGISAAHLQLARDKANQEKGEAFGTPIQITTPDGGTQLMVPKKGTSQVVPMTDGKGEPISKSASIPQAYKERAYNLANLRDNINSYHDAVKNLKTADYFKPSVMADLQAKYGASQMGLKNLFELGVIAGPDMSILAQNLTDPTSIRGLIQSGTGGLEAQNKVIMKMLDNADKNLAGAYNQRPRNQAPATSAAHLSDDQLRKALGI